jgi:membrane protein DedA with SNARE-associated domain
VLLVALLIPILPFAVIGELPGERWLSATDHNARLFGATGATLLAGDVVLPIPSSIVGTLLGARLGFLPGWLWSWSGMVAGNLIGYGGGRLLFARLRTEVPQTPALLVLFASRPVPILAEAVCFAAGGARMAFLPFTATATAGNALYALVLAGNGATLLPDALIGPGLAIPMLLPVAAWLTWRRFATRSATRRR